jgi:asparagine synthase (glutamine-hydrolysing)
MRGLCGWFSTHVVEDGGALLTRMIGSSDPSESDVLARPQAGLAACGGIGRPVLIENDGFLLALAGHPRLAEGNEAVTQPQALLQALRARGKQALASIKGDFALATWDTRSERGLVAIDRIGVHQVVYARTGDGLAFATSLDMLGRHPKVSRDLSPQALFDYLYYHVCPGPQTILKDALRVSPGHCLEFGKGIAPAASAYWAIDFSEGTQRRVDDLQEEFLALLKDAVRDQAEGAAVGSFLSGGTDSSTVSGMLGRVSGTAARTFSIGFDVPGYDETDYARTAARHFGCEHHEYYVTPADVVEAVPKIAASYDQPFGNASAIPTYHCARFAREHGVSRLLAGDGGDELFGGNERYAKQHLLSLYHRVPGSLRAAFEPLVEHLPGADKVRLLRRMRSYVEQARPPMPQRYESYNLLLHLGAREVLSQDFLAGVDTEHPRSLLAQAHAPFAQDSLINQMLGIDLRFILADGDLPKVTHMCNLAGIDVAFPLLDDRLVEFSQRLPSDMKLRGTRLRWFFKEALRNFLPPEIITKKKHGFGLPVGPWLTGHKPLMDLAMNSIALLKPYGIVRPAFLDDLVQTKLREHPAYYGTMVWLLMMLGLWLDAHKAGRGL